MNREKDLTFILSRNPKAFYFRGKTQWQNDRDEICFKGNIWILNERATDIDDALRQY